MNFLKAVSSRANGRQLLTKFLILLAMVPIGWGSFTNAASNILGSQNPKLALRFDGQNSKALALLADQRLLASRDRKNLTISKGMAKRAAWIEPLNPRAMRLLGTTADLQGDKNLAYSFVNLAEQMSRRDFGAHLWMIAHEAENEDYAAVVNSYNRALRTVSESHSLLFPLLSRALVEPKVRNALVPYIQLDSPWLSGFAGYAIGEGGNPGYFAELVLEAGGLPENSGYRSTESQLIKRLVAKNEFALARTIYSTLKGAEAQNLRSLEIRDTNIDPRFSPLTWEVLGRADIAAGFQTDDETGNQELRVIANSGESGEAARKLLFLSAGTYEFRARSNVISGGSDAAISFRIFCAGQTGEMLLDNRVAGSQKAVSINNRFNVPSDCSAQFFSISITGGSTQSGGEFDVTALSIEAQGNLKI